MTTGSGTANSFADVSPADIMLLGELEHHFVATGFTPEKDISRLAGRALLSAVLFGGLLNSAHWSTWLEAVSTHRRLPSHHAIHFPMSEGGRHNWIPDPVTGCIVAMFRKSLLRHPVPAVCGSPSAILQDALNVLARSVPLNPALKEAAASGTDWLVRVCTARLHMRIPALLAQYAAGRVRTHWGQSYLLQPQDSVAKLAKFTASATMVTAWRPRFTDEVLKQLRDAFFPKDPMAAAHSRQLGKAMRSALDEQIAFAAKWWVKDTIQLHMLTWLRDRLDPQAKQTGDYQSKIRPSTARHYLAALASLDWKAVRWKSIYGQKAPQLFTKMFDAMEFALDNIQPRAAESMRNVLGSFSHYLHAKNPKIPARSRPLPTRKPASPRTIVLDGLSFPLLLDMLRTWGAMAAVLPEPDRGTRSRKCVLASILMFRAGLRGTEVVNLALDDIAFEGELAELVVRGSAERENKTLFSRRTLPLHILLQPLELDDLRRWHARRCDEEFNGSPRAKVFPGGWADGLSPEQYLLEPIHAGIRLLAGQSLNTNVTRGERGYWYALASPLRHSFATHLITSLLLPDETIDLPIPDGWTPDLVSIDRKRKLISACLPQGHTGLSLMQVVRYLMGHASYTQSLATYIHRLDWLLAAHLWREVNQLPMSTQEKTGYLSQLSSLWCTSSSSVSGRTQQRKRNAQVKQYAAADAIIRPVRGRPSKTSAMPVRHVSATYNDYVSRGIARPAFFGTRVRPAPVLSPAHHRSDVPERGWLALHNLLHQSKKGVDIDAAARKLAISYDTARRWYERCEDATQIQKRPATRRARSADIDHGLPGPAAPSASAGLAFQQLASGYSHPRGPATQIIDGIWSNRDKLARARHRQRVLAELSRWQEEQPRSFLPKSAVKHVALLLEVGVPADLLVLRVGNGAWQRYSPSLIKLDVKGRVKVTAANLAADKAETKIYHSAILYGLLLSVIDAAIGIEMVANAFAKRTKRGAKQSAVAVPKP